jgi:hypothetical protein
MNINLRGKRIFQGLQAVLVSPKPIRVLAVFSSHAKMREEFRLAINQVMMWGTGFQVRHAEYSIETPIGSVLLFRSVELADHLCGLEVHDFWVDDELESNSWLLTFLSTRARL